MSHTKGPWKVQKGLIYQESSDLGIARIVSKGTEQDAHLISAAPDMLEALEAVVDSMTFNKPVNMFSTKVLEVIRKARKA